MNELETLKAESIRLNKKWTEAKSTYDVVVHEWAEVLDKIAKIETKEKLRAEILAEMANAKPCTCG
jgi:septal ring factor EnvC (AmiA/AmiB activator)